MAQKIGFGQGIENECGESQGETRKASRKRQSEAAEDKALLAPQVVI